MGGDLDFKLSKRITNLILLFLSLFSGAQSRLDYGTTGKNFELCEPFAFGQLLVLRGISGDEISSRLLCILLTTNCCEIILNVQQLSRFTVSLFRL